MDGMNAKMKLSFFVSSVVLVLVFSTAKEASTAGVLLFIIVGLFFLLAFKATHQFISTRWTAAKEKQKKIKNTIRVLERMSQIEPEQLDEIFSGTIESKKENEAKVYHLKPKLGLVQIQEDKKPERTFRNVPYQVQKNFLDLQKIEEEAAKLPRDEKKLVIFISDKTQFLEPELLDSLSGLSVPENAIRREVFHCTDVIEVSIDGVTRHKRLFDQLDQVLGLKYQHYIFLHPQEPENVIRLKIKKPNNNGDDASIS